MLDGATLDRSQQWRIGWGSHLSEKVQAIWLTNSRTMNKTLLTMKGHFLPYRSAAIPKRILPTDRNMSTSVMPQVMSVTDLSKVTARSLAVRETVKKSKASQVCQTSQQLELLRLDSNAGRVVTAARPSIQRHTQAKKATPKKAQW